MSAMSSSDPIASPSLSEAAERESARGRTLVDAGQFDEAQVAFESAIATRRSLAAHQPEQLKKAAIDLSDLAHLHIAAGRFDLAESAARDSIAADPKQALGHCNLGAALRAVGRYNESAAAYGRAASIKPDLIQATFFMGVATIEAGDVETAQAIWRKMIRRMKRPLAMLRDIVVVMSSLGHASKSAEFTRAAIAANPSDAYTLTILSNAIAECGDADEAERLARKVLATAGDRSPMGYFSLGLAQHRKANFADAANSYTRAIELDPTLARAHANLGDSQFALGKMEDGVSSFELGFNLAPTDPYILLKYGAALIRANRTADGLAICEQAVRLSPRSPDALMNLGTVKFDLGLAEEAIAHFRQGVSIDPKHADAHCNLGIALLAEQQLREGWSEYAWRERIAVDAGLVAWNGSDLRGAPIALIAEQGFGDTIQFIRYAKWVNENRHGKPLLVCPEPLVELMKTAPGLDGRVVSSRTDPLVKQARVFQRLMDLPSLAGVDSMDAIEDFGAYLRAPVLNDDDLPLRDSEKRGYHSFPRVGIVWAGNPKHDNDRRRSMTLAQMATAVDPRCELFSLQVGPAADRDRDEAKLRGITMLDDRLTDFSKTASVIDQLDLLLAVDTSVVHLAGAIAKPVWVMLPFNADWRWLRHGDRTPWYRSARLFRQKQLDDWAPVVNEVLQTMRVFVDDFKVRGSI